MLKTKFGIEIEFTGITRRKAAEVIAEYFHTAIAEVGTYYGCKGDKPTRQKNMESRAGRLN